jgi:hypothetical protein
MCVLVALSSDMMFFAFEKKQIITSNVFLIV